MDVREHLHERGVLSVWLITEAYIAQLTTELCVMSLPVKVVLLLCIPALGKTERSIATNVEA